jgi:hypothetical protein
LSPQKITFDRFGEAGRLGNQLWQLVATIGIARKRGFQPIFRHWEYRPFFSFPGEFWPEHLRTTFSDAGVSQSYREKYVPHLDERARIYLQDYSLFADIADEVREWVQPSPKARESLDRSLASMPDLSDVVSLHVRRGDTLTTPPGTATVCSMRYYQQAVRKFPDDQRFLVVSDDIEWCKEHLPNELDRDLMFATGGQVRPPDADREAYLDAGPIDWPDLQLMSMCRGGSIMSNSSYAWWAAFASGNEQVYYPDGWFGYVLHKDGDGWVDTALMFPDNWEQLYNPTKGVRR